MRTPLKSPAGLVLALALLAGGVQGQAAAEAPGPQQKITYQQVNQFIKDFDQAMMSRKPEAILPFFAPQIRLALQDSPSKGGKVKRYDHASFSKVVREAFAVLDSYEVQRRDQLVKVLPGGQSAQHRSVTSEKLRGGGRTLEGQSDQMITVGLVDGQLKIVQIQTVDRD